MNEGGAIESGETRGRNSEGRPDILPESRPPTRQTLNEGTSGVAGVGAVMGSERRDAVTAYKGKWLIKAKDPEIGIPGNPMLMAKKCRHKPRHDPVAAIIA